MTETDHDRYSEDIAAYMLGALGPERAEALELHAEGCERCRAQLRWLTPAVQAISEGVERVEPSPRLRARLLAEVEADAPATATEPRRARFRLPALRPALGFAALLLVAAAVLGYALGGGSEEGGGTRTIVTGKAPGVTAKMVSEGEAGTLRLDNVDQLPDGKVLEAWVRRDGEVEPVRALFVPDHEGRASTQLPSMDGVEVVMVTAEPKGGSEAPTGEPLITIPVPQ
ncbi:MAG TPA: anti-sigma factor [Solirubrobacterales bacterium]|nr:anti-sigma factor [Solirubrobacterales bacterium]